MGVYLIMDTSNSSNSLDISQMLDLGIIQLAIKFCTFFVPKVWAPEKVLLLGEGFELASTNLNHSGVKIELLVGMLPFSLPLSTFYYITQQQ